MAIALASARSAIANRGSRAILGGTGNGRMLQMRILAAFLTALTLLGFAGAASADCSWGSSSQSTADGDEKILLPGQTS
jgi:hypothetical protein